MKIYKTKMNNGIKLTPAKRNLNYCLIGTMSALLVIIDMYNYYTNNLVSSIQTYILSLTLGYALYTAIILLAIKLWGVFTYPTKVSITTDGIEANIGLLKYRNQNTEFVIDDVPNNVKKHYKSSNPKMLFIEFFGKKWSYIVFDQTEIDKLKK